MATTKPLVTSSRFPAQRPPIVIAPSRAAAFKVDCRELRWWSVIPQVGQSAAWASYEEPNWTLTAVHRARVLRPAAVHGVAGVEISVTTREREDRPLGPWKSARPKTVYACLMDDKARWLAIIEEVRGKQDVSTFLDRGFDADFGEATRQIEDRGLLVQNPDGSYLLSANPRGQAQESYGAGVFEVKVGRRRFTCLRAVEPNWGAGPEGCFMEAYLTRAGRTVLYRHYRSPGWALHREWAKKWTGGKTWDQAFPGHAWIIVNGRRLYHWLDCLTEVAFGLGAP